MPIIEGKHYSYGALSKRSGVSEGTLIKRYKANPNMSLEELTRPVGSYRNERYVTVDGRQIRLYDWAKMNGCSIGRIDGRWYMGVRDPYELIAPSKRKVKTPEPTPVDTEPMKMHLTEEQKTWLRETAYARTGMANRWEIACDLLGLPRSAADWVRREMESDHAGSD